MLKTIKSAIRSISLAVAITYGAIVAPEVHNHYLRYEVGESVVRVLSMHSDGGGTGFAIKGNSGKEYIMTNRHVCEVQSNGVIRVKPPGKKAIYRKVVHMDKIHDLCLIEGIKGLAPISIGSDQLKGDTLYVVGHPGLRQLTVSKGEYIGRDTIELIYDVVKKEHCPGRIVELPPIVQFLMGREYICLRSYESLQTTALIYGGNSGSPVVNKFGNLIGVAFAGNTQQEHDNYIVPLYYVKKLLAKF
jgi:S1-C subfamily serine protease